MIPLREFEGWGINRRFESISFGCGYVVIPRKDLRQLVAYSKDKTLIEDLKLVAQLLTFDDNNVIMKYNQKNLLTISRILSKKGVLKALSFYKKVAKLTKGRKSVIYLLNVAPGTLQRILGE